MRQLEPGCAVLVHPPLVVAGDLPRANLEERYTQVIEPAAAALRQSYFAAVPGEPITLLVLRDAASFREHARRLFGDRPVSPLGFYRPQLRMILVNAQAGDGPLDHELTHALMAFDFPKAPTWLSEGLAALHEDCTLDASANRLTGNAAARLATLVEARRRGTAGRLREMLADDDFHGPQEAVRYAVARHFCRYLQHEGLLETVYRRLRDAGPLTAGQQLIVLQAATHLDAATLEDRFWAFVLATGNTPDHATASR